MQSLAKVGCREENVMANNIRITRQKKVCDNFSTCEERVLLMN